MRFRRGDVLWRLVPGRLLPGEDMGDVLEVTGSGADVWSLLDPSSDATQFAATLADRYDAPIARIDGDRHDLFDDLGAKGFILRDG